MMLTLIITVCRSTTCTKMKNDIQCRGYLKLAFWNWPHEISKSGSADAVCGGLNSYSVSSLHDELHQPRRYPRLRRHLRGDLPGVQTPGPELPRPLEERPLVDGEIAGPVRSTSLDRALEDLHPRGPPEGPRKTCTCSDIWTEIARPPPDGGIF